ncbi:hypothetical protein [Novosphingobium album (ex Hu et al. 2023)]|uniref:Uncharacterized protein n=1 Tax=Novosphingobium album (ex Hu et al. 2023) TaxID=2930093 RepID=A0ABT0AZH8_9SPHN|nr:hypothetical protein [Novosphingobium album (ex Hu et al. 2023)]MCJ2178191.1 hypothetical protein [Novosphingobium album (ex Hu et al. 2023)]
MKLLRWAVGGASAYVIYKYSIGRKAKGEDVFATPEKAVAKMTGDPEPAKKKPEARRKTPAAGTAKVLANDAEAAKASSAEKPKRPRAPRKKRETQ